MRTKFILISIMLIINISYGQTFETLKNVIITESLDFSKKVKVTNCDENVKKDDIVKTETVFKDNSQGSESTKTVIKEEKIKSDSTIKVDKEVTIKMKSFDGKANIYVDEKDNSIIHVNYWLNPINKLSKDTNIQYQILAYDCNGKPTRNISSPHIKLSQDTKFRLYKYDQKNLGSEQYIINSDTIVAVYGSDDKTIEYFLVNKYDRKVDYTFQLANRETITLRNESVVFGPVTIPIKYRFPFKKKGIEVKEDYSADFNVGLFCGKTIGKQKVNYQRGVGFKDNFYFWSVTIGGFFNISTTSLSKTNTTVGDIPITTEVTQNIGVLSSGIGLMKSIYNFQFGVFYGWDFGIGKDSNNWNYDGKPWLGVGLAYSLTSFWKK